MKRLQLFKFFSLLPLYFLLESHDSKERLHLHSFAGDYAGYWVSPEEYLEQRYEGSSTIYGRESATALEQRLAALAAEVRSPRSDDSS